jgi:hypothetical protein
MTMIGLAAHRVDEFNNKVAVEVDRIATFIAGAAA